MRSDSCNSVEKVGRPRVLFALPGLHAVDRGAEVAIESIACRLAANHGFDVTLMGAGEPRPKQPYTFVHVPRIVRERFRGWPRLPLFRTETAYEEATFAAAMLRRYKPSDFDVTVTCGYPFMNWLLRSRRRDGLPRHVYVTQNGDWPCYRLNAEYRHFGCDLLICTNPDYFCAHRERFPACILIPNGVDPAVFHPDRRPRVGAKQSTERPLILMVSALIPSKRVLEGMRAIASVPGAELLIAGDGPQRAEVERIGQQVLPGRFSRRAFRRDEMADVFRRASAFLHMSIDEPSANAYMEALATGLPIVAHDRLVTRWTFDGNAYLVDTTDSAAVAQAVSDAIAEKSEAKVAERVAMAQSRYDWNIIASQYAREIRKLVAKS